MTALTDAFTRADEATLGTPWTQVIALAQLVSNQVVYTDPTCLYVNQTSLATVTHYLKFTYAGLADVNVNQPSYVFRYVDSSSPYYALHFLSDTNTVEWRSHSSSADTTGTLIQSAALTIGTTATWGMTVKGTGNNTEVRIWDNPSGLPTDSDTWGGSPTLTFTNNPGTACDTGVIVGFGCTTGNPFSMSSDNWFGGDIALALVLPPIVASVNWHHEFDWLPQRYDLPIGVDLLFDDFSPDASAATPGAIVGTASITFSQAGDLKGAGALIGTSAITFSQTGLLRGSGALVGTSTITFSQSGALAGAGALVGTSTITFTQTGNLLGAGALAGTTQITFAGAADLKATGALSGSTTIVFSATGSLDQGALSGTASITFSQSGTLQATGDLSGSTSITFSQFGDLTNSTAGAIVGTASITFSATGNLTNATPVEQPVGGGWNGLFFHFEQHRARGELELREIEERERDTASIQDELDRQIAELLRLQELEDARRAESTRLQRLADMAAAAKPDLPPHVIVAIERAAQRRSYAALQRMQREILQMYAEEEAAVIAALMLDDD